mgnify:CR=1 FL=1
MDLTEEKRKEIETTFNVPSLRENQVNGIKAISNGKDVFLGLKIGSGKLIIYESLPIVYPSATIIVITALVSIM